MVIAMWYSTRLAVLVVSFTVVMCSQEHMGLNGMQTSRLALFFIVLERCYMSHGDGNPKVWSCVPEILACIGVLFWNGLAWRKKFDKIEGTLPS